MRHRLACMRSRPVLLPLLLTLAMLLAPIYSIPVNAAVPSHAEHSVAGAITLPQEEWTSIREQLPDVFAATQTPGAIAQQAYLKASTIGASDLFGYSVALAGNTLVVGARLEDSSATGVGGNQTNDNAMDSGAAFVFVRSGTTWSQQAYLKASNTSAGDAFGHSVAIAGDTIVVGASQEDVTSTGVNGNQTTKGASNSGAAYVFVRSGTTWAQQAYLKASNTGSADEFGYSVAIAGDTIIVGAPFERSAATGVGGIQSDNSAVRAGAAYVFVRSDTTWTQQAYLKASNTGSGDEFGWSLAVSSDTIVVGAHREYSAATGVNGNQADNSKEYAGAAYVFVRSGTTWSQQAYLKASNSDVGDEFGESVAIDGDTLIIAAYREYSAATGINGNQANNSAQDAGAVYVFVRSGTTWSQQAYLKASNTNTVDWFGRSLTISGDTVVVGAIGEDSAAIGINGNQSDNSASGAGAAYVFVRSGTTWSQQTYLKASNTAPGAGFGQSVAFDGDTIVIGASWEDSAQLGSGAAYVFAPNVAPFANAGPDQNVKTSTLVTLDGSASSDLDDHTPLSYQWTQTGGPVITLSGASSSNPSFTAPDIPTILTFTLRVMDRYDLPSVMDDEVVVTVTDAEITGLTATSSSPTVIGQTTFLTATTVAGSNVTYTWDFGDGTVGSGATASHIYTTAGPYTATVTAVNSRGSASATTRVSVTNTAPSADAGPDQHVKTSTLVTLDGSASSDPDGHTPLSYQWTQTGGAPVSLTGPSSASPSFTAPSIPTVLTFTLRVTDSYGLPTIAVDEVVVAVTDVAIAGLIATSSSPTVLGQTTLLTATIGAGSNVTYTWDFGDGTGGSGATASHLYTTAGPYTATVIATNTVGSVRTTTSVSVTNAAPVAHAGPDQRVEHGVLVMLDGSASLDPDGHTPLSYQWTQTGGPPVVLNNAFGVAPSFIAQAGRVLTFTLTITDSMGLASLAPDSIIVNVDLARTYLPIVRLALGEPTGAGDRAAQEDIQLIRPQRQRVRTQ